MSQTQTQNNAIVATSARVSPVSELAPFARRPSTEILTVVAHIILWNPDSYDYVARAAHSYLHDDYMADDDTKMETLRKYQFSAASWQAARDRMTSPHYVMPRGR